MAERRMFSKRIINSARFLKMPVSTQCLYFHLGLHADDDGIVEAYTIMNSIGATEDDLKILVAKNFIVVLNEDLVSYIVDWKENNKIRADRKVDSIYKELLVQILPDVELQQKRQRADVSKKLLAQEIQEIEQPMDDQWTTNGQPMDGIGKDRLGKDSIGKDRKVSKKESKKSFDDLIDSYTSNPELQEELKNHLATRKAKKATLTNRAIELSLKKLDELTSNIPVNMQEEAKIKIVQQSIERGWVGFFELKEQQTFSNKKSSGWDYMNEEYKKIQEKNDIF